MKVYSMYGRKSLEQVRDIIEDMGVTHYVLENSWCVRKTRDGCQMPEIWDIEEPDLAVSLINITGIKTPYLDNTNFDFF